MLSSSDDSASDMFCYSIEFHISSMIVALILSNNFSESADFILFIKGGRYGVWYSELKCFLALYCILGTYSYIIL